MPVPNRDDGMDIRPFVIAAGAVLTSALLTACSGPSAPRAHTTTRPSLPSQATTPTRSTTSTSVTTTGFLAQSASFVTVDVGFVLGVTSCSTGTCLSLMHTVDRGASWVSASPPPTTLGATDTTGVSELHFADAVDGWAFGGSLWATHDGGQEWQAVDIGGPVVAMASGAGVVYALVEPCASAPCTDPGHLYRSPVAQNSWSEVPVVSGQFDRGAVSLVAEGQTVFVLSAYPEPEILGSSDGVHFTALPVPCSAEPEQPGPFAPASLAASDPDDLAVACLGGVAAGSQAKQLYISHDGGHSYQRLPDPPLGGDGAELAMPAPTTVLLGAWSGATQVYRIAPPDSSWTTPLIFGDGGVGVTDLGFVDPAHGAVIHGNALTALPNLSTANPPSGLGTLYLTGDGGAGWQPAPIPR